VDGRRFASTPEELARWAQALSYGGRVWWKEMQAQMLTGVDAGQGRGGGRGNRYGLGVQVRESPWGTSYGHGGWFPGLPERRWSTSPTAAVAVAVQFNTDAGRSIKKGLRAYVGDVAKLILDGAEKPGP